MSNAIRVATEALETNSEEEREYGFFVLLSEEQLASFLQIAEGAGRSKGYSYEGILEVALPSKVPYNGIKSRLRLYSKSNGEQSCELTTKKAIANTESDVTVKKEVNDPIDIINFQALAGGGKSVIARKRFIIPMVDAEGYQLERKSGKPLQWEVDVYLDGSNSTAFGERRANNWIKIDLEVDSDIPNVIDILPIEGERVISADSTATDEREIIDGLYANGYPLTPYIGLEFWDNQDEVISLVTF